jgi:hypothetical protein
MGIAAREDHVASGERGEDDVGAVVGAERQAENTTRRRRSADADRTGDAKTRRLLDGFV